MIFDSGFIIIVTFRSFITSAGKLECRKKIHIKVCIPSAGNLSL
jgi:hypothetical protein